MRNVKTSFLLCMFSWPSSTFLKNGISVSKGTDFFGNLTLLEFGYETEIAKLS